MQRESDAADDVGKVEPDLDPAEMGAFRATGSSVAGADVARRADIFCKFRMNAAEFSDLIHGRSINFFLSVEASAHGPLVEQMQERTGFDKADGF